MQLPKRRSQMLLKRDDRVENNYLTPEGIERLKKTLHDLEKIQRPKIVEDLSFALSLGDFSENAEYQDAKHRLSKIDGRIFGMKERIKHAIPITQELHADGEIRLGSTVTVHVAGKQKTYQIVGPHETNPARGRISLLSPIGSALLHHVIGDEVPIQTPSGEILYQISDVT